jgi:hypothetical protein
MFLFYLWFVKLKAGSKPEVSDALSFRAGVQTRPKLTGQLFAEI